MRPATLNNSPYHIGSGLAFSCYSRLRTAIIPFNVTCLNLPRFSARSLYLLALFQLVAGPLVLVAVLTFCKTVVHEVPEQGVVKAVSFAWQSDAVQSLVDTACDQQAGDSTAKGPVKKMNPDTGKFIAIAWDAVAPHIKNSLEVTPPNGWMTSWTPAWPQAPPGTPPRVA